jgi:RimJ/RimL family protein N-acetyltransferase
VTTPLTTERMLLRRFTDADLDWLAQLHGDPAVMRYIDDGRPVSLAVVVDETLPTILRDYAELPDGLGYFAATEKSGGRPLGWFGITPPSSTGLDRAAIATAELGYRLFPAEWRRGYATEGARRLVRRAFTELGLDRVVATTMTVNIASRRVLEKAGLSLVRTFYAQWPTYIEGAEHGDVVYEIAGQDWRPATSRARAAGRPLYRSDGRLRG